MLRIPVTTLENVRLYLTDKITTEKLVECITKPYQATRKMQLGTAIHDILENYHNRYVAESNIFISCNGFRFETDIIDKIYSHIDKDAPFEIKEVKIYELDSEAVEVVGKVDQLHGAIVYENKTTWSGFNSDRYYDSYQWRYYLDMFEAELVIYNVFCLTETKKKGIELKEINKLKFTAYPTLGADVRRLLETSVNIINRLQLRNYLTK